MHGKSFILIKNKIAQKLRNSRELLSYCALTRQRGYTKLSNSNQHQVHHLHYTQHERVLSGLFVLISVAMFSKHIKAILLIDQ